MNSLIHIFGPLLISIFIVTPLGTCNENSWTKLDITGVKIALEKGMPKISLEILQGLIKERPNSLEVHFYLGETYKALGELKMAAYHYEFVTHLNPKYQLAWEKLGYCYEKLGLFYEAKKVYLKRLEINDHDVDLWILYSRFLKEKRYYHDAEEAIWTALSLVPKDLELNREYALLLEKMNSNSKVIAKQWANVLEISPKDLMARYHLAQAYEHLKEIKEAKKNYLILVKNNPKFPEAYLRLGIIYTQENFLPEAYYYFKKFKKLTPYASLAYQEIIKLYKKEKKKRLVIKTYQQWRQAIPYNEQVYLDWGDYLIENKDIDRALNVFMSGLDKIPQSIGLLEKLGNFYFEKRDWKLVKFYFTKILEHTPHNELALSRLARCSIEENELTVAKAYLTLLRKLIEDREELSKKGLIQSPSRLPASENAH